MTNEQLYLAIGIPMLVTILGFVIQSQRLSSIERRLDDVHSRMLGIETAMRGVYEMAGRHDEAIDSLKKRGER